MTLQNLVGGLALDQTVQDTKASIDSLKTTPLTVDVEVLTALTIILQAILEKMPRTSRIDALVVDLAETGLTNVNANQVINAASNPNTGQIFYRTNEAFQFSNAGSFYLYNQIVVS